MSSSSVARKRGLRMMDIESVIRRIDELGLRQTLDPPDVYPPAPRGRGARGRQGRAGGRMNHAEDVHWVQDPFDFELPDSVGLTPAQIRKATGEAETEGTDAFAWYEPFHFNGDDRWGIYVRLSGVDAIALGIFLPSLTSASRQSKIDGLGDKPADAAGRVDVLRRLAFGFLFQHEYFHFLTEIASTIPEVGNWQAGLAYYRRYARDVYGKPVNLDEPLEEAMANVLAFSALRRAVRSHPVAQKYRTKWEKPLLLATERFLKGQPKGYRSYHRFTGLDFRRGRGRLGAQICNGVSVVDREPPLELLFGVESHSVAYGDVPIRLVQ